MAEKNTAKRLTGGMMVLLLLALCLCITTFALVWATVSIENNFFSTGQVTINLNDGRPLIHENEFVFEPNMTVEKTCFIENESSLPVYYRLYFDQVSGGLADVLEITVSEGDKLLYHGTANELSRARVAAADDVLQVNERRQLTVRFHFPAEAGNRAQDGELTFVLCAEATQMKNNPNRLFA